MVTGEKGTWDDRVLEIADCFKDKDTYYWYYHAHSESSPDAGYQLGVATAKDPLGPWKKTETCFSFGSCFFIMPVVFFAELLDNSAFQKRLKEILMCGIVAYLGKKRDII